MPSKHSSTDHRRTSRSRSPLEDNSVFDIPMVIEFSVPAQQPANRWSAGSTSNFNRGAPAPKSSRQDDSDEDIPIMISVRGPAGCGESITTRSSVGTGNCTGGSRGQISQGTGMSSRTSRTNMTRRRSSIGPPNLPRRQRSGKMKLIEIYR
ncbi:expressed unknown protein [Seminavis robusta]|uniref:Uncharacterized protein n=1 Tax=Seminavis robusta TaxID=568900 RepID=A0A9N8DY95_9STRA|nr:expressed unknown protein [Seminavis robusta]|eukprot:Sro364_g127001.1  (151) ;mRNA; f:6180-6632